MKTQAQHSFSRILGRAPVVRPEKYRCFDHPNLLSETFGPPELLARKRSTVVFWNFERQDGTKGFTLFARVRRKSEPNQIEICVAARSGVRSFFEWTIDRLSGVESGEESPLFVNSGAFAIARL